MESAWYQNDTFYFMCFSKLVSNVLSLVGPFPSNKISPVRYIDGKYMDFAIKHRSIDPKVD